MKTRSVVSIALSALLLGGALAGGLQGTAIAGSHAPSPDARKAAAEAAKARALLAKGKGAAAVGHAERAVAFAPDAADFRMVLAQSYLKAGRFASARDAFSDVLSLDAGNGKAALNLALAQIATGDFANGRKTLDAHVETIPVADRGLAIALAGDPGTAVDLLVAAARASDATPKTRQNLALALALAGRWQEARGVMAIDVAPAEVDKRIVAWAAFVRPKAASDQVASLLGVKAVADKGQPAALALNAAASPVAQAPVAQASTAPVAVPTAPAQDVAAAPVAVPAQAVAAVAPPADQPAPITAAQDATPSLNTGVQFAARQEVVESLPATAVVAVKPKLPTKPALAKVIIARPTDNAPRALASGTFYVQLGAYDNAAVAKDAWKRASRQFTTFSGHAPQGSSVKTAAGSFYRLSVGGYTRADAVKLCLSYRATGGRCFVRAGAGDQVANWVKPSGPQLASR